MAILRKDTRGPQVSPLQPPPTQRGCAAGTDGSFDARIRQALRALLAQHLDPQGRRLVAGGALRTIEGNRSLRVSGFSHVPSRTDRLLGQGGLP